MSTKVPITLITGFLGSGKTTLLRHVLETIHERVAVLMNEFGEIAVDAKVIRGENVLLAELDGGCVCCSLLGEFEAAVEEIIETADPERILVETTGVAEPQALSFDIQENLPQVRLDGVVTVVDAPATIQFPELGKTARMQIEAADTLILNKIDLVSAGELEEIEGKLKQLNPRAPVVRATRCRIPLELLFGTARNREVAPPGRRHRCEFEWFSVELPGVLNRERFEAFLGSLDPGVYRAKGLIRLSEGTHLFNFVAGRWELESAQADPGEAVFIGRGLEERVRGEIRRQLRECLD